MSLQENFIVEIRTFSYTQFKAKGITSLTTCCWNLLNIYSGSLTWDIHFWLGSESTQDEMGVAAYKTCELDESLGGGPVQHREVQGNESDAFLSLFKKLGGLEYLSGGVASGFKHVEKDSYPTRLLLVKGKRVVKQSEVPCSNKSLNSGDVFILDKGLKLFYFAGKFANKAEKTKGFEVISNINNSRGKQCNIIWMDAEQDTEIPTEGETNEFWETLGGSVDVDSLPAGPADDAEVAHTDPLAFKISDASGSAEFTALTADDVIVNHKLNKAILDPNDVFLIVTSEGLYIWVGKGSTVQEKKEATNHAVKYLADHGLPNSTRVERVLQDHESNTFKSLFHNWNTFITPDSFTSAMANKVASRKPDPVIDISTLLSTTDSNNDHVDISTHANAKIVIYRIENFNKVEIPLEK